MTEKRIDTGTMQPIACVSCIEHSSCHTCSCGELKKIFRKLAAYEAAEEHGGSEPGETDLP